MQNRDLSELEKFSFTLIEEKAVIIASLHFALMVKSGSFTKKYNRCKAAGHWTEP